MEDGACLVLFERPKPAERDDLEDGTSHIALQVSNEDFETAVAQIESAGARMAIGEVERERQNLSGQRDGYFGP